MTSSSSSSSSKRQRSSNDDDGAEGAGAGSGSYHHETLLPPNKAATESSGIAALDGMVEHLVEALKQKLEVPLATAVETVVGRATEQLKTNVGRVFDQREERKRGKRKAKKREDLGLLFPFLSRAIFIFLVHSHPRSKKISRSRVQ